MRLECKTAIVTGAANGIGRAIAQLFAKEGAQVVVCDIDLDAAARVVDRIKGEGHESIFVHKTRCLSRNSIDLGSPRPNAGEGPGVRGRARS